MAGGTKVEKKTKAMKEESYESEYDASIAESKASSSKKKKKKKYSGASTAASTSSTARKKTANKYLENQDDVMSELAGMSTHSSQASSKKNKKKVPKKIKRQKVSTDDDPETDDVISCLTENSKSVQGTKKKKKKKKSASKKTKLDDDVDETYEKYQRSDSTSNMSERSKSSKRTNSSVRKKFKNAPAGTKNDDEVSITSESSNSKRKKKNTLTKLNRRDMLYHNRMKSGTSVTSAYYSRDSHDYDASDDNDDSLRRTRSSSHDSRASRGSRASRVSRASNASSTASSVVKDGHVQRKIKKYETTPKRSRSVDQHDQPRRSSGSRRARSVDRDEILFGSSDNDSDSVSLSDSSDEVRKARRRPSKTRANKRPEASRQNSKMRSPKTGKRKTNGRLSNSSSHSHSSHSASSRRHPVRLSARGDSIEVRSLSADNVKQMQRSLARNPSHRSNGSPSHNTNGRIYAAPAPHDASPLRRGVSRNSSAPLRKVVRQPSNNRMGPGRGQHHGRGQHPGRGPFRSTKSAYLQQQQQQRRPPPRTNSREMSMTEHVEMLHGVLNHSPSNKSVPARTGNNLQRQRSLDRMAGTPGDNHRRRGPPKRSASPNRGILRNSSHGHDNSQKSFKGMSQHSFLSKLSKGDIDYSSDMDEYDVENADSDDDNYYDLKKDDSKERDEELKDGISRDISRTRSKFELKRGGSERGWGLLSAHSFRSTRSKMSVDRTSKFESDSKWKAALRYIHLLPPTANETKLQRKVRIFTWISMLLDFIAAMVAVVQYSGATQCCDQDIFDLIMDINWTVCFRIMTWLYVAIIFAEIIPVVKKGMPINLINPLFGFLITFGMFFDDSIFEAVAMWVIEALAIFFEFLVYRTNARIYFETTFELKKTEEELETLKIKRKQIVGNLMTLNGVSAHNSINSGSLNGGSMHSGSYAGSMHGSRHGRPMHRSRHGHVAFENSSRYSRDMEMGVTDPSQKPRTPVYDDDDDDDSLSGHSFGDDDEFYDEKTPSGRSLGYTPREIKPRLTPRPVPVARIPGHLNRTNSRDALGASNHSYGASTAVTGFVGGNRVILPGEVKQNRLLRQRRMLRENKIQFSNDLYISFVGTLLNVGFAVLALVMIVTIASTGGVCFHDNTVNFFSFDQLGSCNMCPKDRALECQKCDGEALQCYFPYY